MENIHPCNNKKHVQLQQKNGQKLKKNSRKLYKYYKFHLSLLLY